MLNDSEISSFASASIWSDSSVGYFRASSLKTSVICTHASAHDAQKYRRDTRWRSAERRDLNCSEDSTWWRFVFSGSAMADLSDPQGTPRPKENKCVATMTDSARLLM